MWLGIFNVIKTFIKLITFGRTCKGSTFFQATPKLEIVKIQSVREVYKQGWINRKRTTAPTEIVIHGTGGGTSVKALVDWMFGGQFADKYNNGVGLFHYVIGRGDSKGEEQDGLVAEIIDPDYWVHHGTSGQRGAQVQIGIELMNPSNINSTKYTDAQYESLYRLIFEVLIKRYPAIKTIVGHKWSIWHYNSAATAANNDKGCPGKGFDWGQFVALCESKGIQFKDISKGGERIGYEII